jgi:SAM-dependent methyltransferase
MSRPPEPPATASLGTDRQHLTTSAYGSGANLAARQAIYAYQQPIIDLPAWALARVDWRDGLTVLDLGCGNGAYLRRLAARPTPPSRLLGLDLSRGMLADLTGNWPAGLPPPGLAVADARALPLPDASVDVALAMHMLYHVPDIARAVAEVRRVLRPGGVLLAATNGQAHLHELDMAETTDQPPPALFSGGARFTLENGAAWLQTAFATVERRDAFSTLVVPDPAPVVRYVASMTTLLDPLFPAGPARAALLAAVERRVAAAIAADGAFRVSTRAGLFRCT